ncbi:endonuclease/exonuclease/phosphatase family protein [Jiulongibacter sp. NS-SX5]|uniref:endonuclease/exonuclease/phosphatase family protein n=1 Tax=Jiulongibacter sp. NS-SX5 TaxID=3463854 RepID=UPI00405A4049
MKKSGVLILLLPVLMFASCQTKQLVSLKVMSYNIRHGEGLDLQLDLSRAAQVIQNEAPDLCGLQEIDHHCTRSDSVNQTEYLAQQTGMKGTFGAFMDFQGGQYGMATLAGLPLVSTMVLTLPEGLHEPRSAIFHEVEIAKGCSLIFANVHFDWISSQEGSDSRLKQAKALLNYIDSLDKAVIITGDFNCAPDSPTMQYFYDQGFTFIKKGEDHLSFQGEEKVEIDHVIYRNSKTQIIKPKSIRLLNEPLVSDHRPLVAELEVEFH